MNKANIGFIHSSAILNFRIVLFILLIYYGIDYAVFGLKSISPASGIRRFWPYLSIPVGGGFLLIQAFARLIHLLFTDDKTIRAEEEARARHEILAVEE